MSAVARFPSKCPACLGSIAVGDVIVPDPTPNGAQPWVHETCPAGRLDIVRSVCPECFTERSVTGQCMCPEVA